MKKVILSFGILSLVCFFFVSCSSDPSTPATDGSSLIVEPNTLTLAQTDSTRTLDLVMSCGCGFTVQVIGATGDTDVIKYAPIDKMDTSQSMHQIQFMYSPSSAAPGPHSIKVDFLAKKKSYTYTNSVVVNTP